MYSCTYTNTCKCIDSVVLILIHTCTCKCIDGVVLILIHTCTCKCIDTHISIDTGIGTGIV